MGQYYRAISLSPRYKRCKNTTNAIVAALSPYDYGSLAKLVEHSYVGNQYVNAAMKLLATKGYGLPFVWCGDYYGEFPLQDDNGSLHSCANEWLEHHGKHLNKQIKNVELDNWNYIINFDKMLYVKIPPFNPTKFTHHPLPLLCCAGNGEGGGDYILDEDDKNYPYVGSWAFDRIGVSVHRPSPKFKKLNIKFKLTC